MLFITLQRKHLKSFLATLPFKFNFLCYQLMAYHRISHSVSLSTNTFQAKENAAFFCVFPATEKLNKFNMQTSRPNNSI